MQCRRNKKDFSLANVTNRETGKRVRDALIFSDFAAFMKDKCIWRTQKEMFYHVELEKKTFWDKHIKTFFYLPYFPTSKRFSAR